MACLHLVSSTPGLAACLSVSGDGDALVLLGDGTYAGCRPDPAVAAAALRWFAMNDDLAARGLTGRLRSEVASIDHDDLVRLVVEYPRSASWS